MKIKYLAFLAIATAVTLVSCKKKNSNNPDNKNIYVSANTPNGYAYWKNNEMTTVPNSISTYGSQTMVVNNGDVYFPSQGGYLKNGNQVNIPGAGMVNRIAVSGGDVYAIGYRTDTSDTIPFYWKNGVVVHLPSILSGSLELIGLAVSGNDVYVAATHLNHVGYFDNDGFHEFEGNNASITVSGSDVYFYGTTDGGYVKNGTHHKLHVTNDTASVLVTDLCVSGNDVYAVGMCLSNNVPLYWKNDMPVNDGALNSYTPYSITVDGNDVYVLADQITVSPQNQSDAYIWKNSVKSLFQSNCKATKIFIGK